MRVYLLGIFYIFLLKNARKMVPVSVLLSGKKVVRKTFVDMLTCCDLPDFVTHSKKVAPFSTLR